MDPESYAIRVETEGQTDKLVKGFRSIAHAEWWIEVELRHAPRGGPRVRYFILEWWEPSGLPQCERLAA
ncbi:MAG TPA: hypothetical protein VH678_20600 [Xanthobacteraceae bacterium]|jgi:hypothetical protein